MKTIIANQQLDEERALYNLKNTEVKNCVFAGPADGESALKEARGVTVNDCDFSLKYPLWHAERFEVLHSRMDETTRAPLWYAKRGLLERCTINGIKAVRECYDITINKCRIVSPEFGWKNRKLRIIDSEIESEYLLFESRDMEIDRLRMKGKYSFQYVKNVHIRDSVLDTKDAFWHAKNVTVENSVLSGEYLAWFCDGLTFVNCEITGTQPLCYCKNLKLINCTMEGVDLAFEYSDVDADIRGNAVSIKNPKSGVITVDSVGEIIWDDAVMDCKGKVIVRSSQ